ncbi:MAG TPA: UPF0175 family protein [Candidatus Acidoferrum sp.]|nr:UPF0175 family protein [Candidatus Acidoferrum sp.]
MEITLKIPDEIAQRVAPEGEGPARVTLESLALEGYRSEALTESDVRQMLGFSTRMTVHAFLKEHGVYLHYSMEELEQDLESARTLLAKLQAEPASSTPR